MVTRNEDLNSVFSKIKHHHSYFLNNNKRTNVLVRYVHQSTMCGSSQLASSYLSSTGVKGQILSHEYSPNDGAVAFTFIILWFSQVVKRAARSHSCCGGTCHICRSLSIAPFYLPLPWNENIISSLREQVTPPCAAFISKDPSREQPVHSVHR